MGTVSRAQLQTSIKTCNVVTFYKFLMHLGMHHTHIKRVSYLQYLDEKEPCKGKESRLCLDNLTLLKKHIYSMKRGHGASFNMCGN
jgi:hypothetical protein